MQANELTVSPAPVLPDDVTARFIHALLTYSRLSRSWEAFEGRGMTKIQMAILTELSRRGDQRVTMLSETLGVELSVISRQITALYEAGAVARVRDPEDGRAWLLTISGQGEELLAEARKRRHAWFSRVLADFDDDQREIAARILETVNAEWASIQHRPS
ncbi:MAG: MarR family transcriptional regulator [Propionicimonas sp.]|uniref:MarR family winged helix-turn-helix transcriptional regulator n=1 Tax=Propionicimonas sp. TaxID=1955623 RepID=UPI002B1F2A36|nr:MarR family transcriptional regulator [Propionicimonas sp.]MEA4944374.1 MarR family transcriptional regulator [Propionicimonas sp.]MEA5052018.1 MarR family transcriptional regulator [Propionicimonas sp.]MEA5116683.1 MarR family transcriptional regulator [Propionicimonas sp.]